VHFFFFREAWRSFRHHGGLAATAILSLTAALSLSGIFLLLEQNAQFAMDMVGDRREMVVYLHDDVSREQRDALVARLQQLFGEVTYVSKDQAWTEFTDQVGDPALLEAVEGNPLPASLRVKLKTELLNFPAMEKTAKIVSEFPEVEDVRYGGEWVRRLDSISLGLKRGALAVGLVVAGAILVVLYNTIRLTVLARRPQVEIMSRLGATDRFISTPFVLEAMLEAALASLIALGIVFAFHRAFVSQVVNLVFLPLHVIAAFVGIAIVLAWIAAELALTRVLRSGA